MSKIIPDLIWDKTLPFPLNNTWGYHDAATGNGHWENYYKEGVKRYGEPKSMEDFCNKMQLLNAIGYQGIFEAAGHKLNDIGGVMLWKLNAAFPSVVWQVYDWFLVPNAGYYFMQNACEPVHIQLNTKDLNVEYINRTYKPLKSLTALIEVFDRDSKSLFHNSEAVELSSTGVKEASSLANVLKGNEGVSFVDLNLKDLKGNTVSHNVYWIASNNDFKSLNDLPDASVTVRIVDVSGRSNEKRWTFRFSNTSDRIAFFINPQLISGGEEIAPSFWSANYFTLAPNESVTATVACPPVTVSGETLVLKVVGWNVNETVIPLMTGK
jgi:hypothetical protein